MYVFSGHQALKRLTKTIRYVLIKVFEQLRKYLTPLLNTFMIILNGQKKPFPHIFDINCFYLFGM